MRQRCVVAIEGVVQGVGFRPFVHGLAIARGLAGRVRNDAHGVAVEVEGERLQIDAFLGELVRDAPPLARVGAVQAVFGQPLGASGFRIDDSGCAAVPTVQVAADAATCDDCLRELFDPADRRYGYAFLNCTRCGPRLTILRDVPYDRARTTMAAFAMCSACRAEYENPADRRFHAQPIACPACGPRLSIRAPDWSERAGDPLAVAAAALRDGLIVAVKGLGGYHVACDAANDAAVRRLRVRKRREAKPFAVMVADLDQARTLCRIDSTEAAVLVSPRRPIVLLRRQTDCPLAPAVAPGNRDLGLMLPHSPLHHLLLRSIGSPLVMTSGNVSDQPIAYDDDQARERLAGIADLFLTHDRPIETRCDDSVTRVVLGGEVPIRRSRGHSPHPVRLPVAARSPLLAVGGDLKGCFALVRGADAFLSHHIGDLADLATWLDLEKAVAHYERLLGIRPAVVAHDLHPGYLSTRFATGLDGVEHVGVQHHHAHVAACIAEHGARGPVIGVAFDGTGYGPDGTIWGGEFLVADLRRYERVGCLRPVPLAGGDAAARQPWRSAAAHLHAAGLACDAIARRIGDEHWTVVAQLLDRQVGCMPTSSVGRLFDAVAALLGLGDTVRFEAEAAIALEAAADDGEASSYPVKIADSGTLRLWDPAPIVDAVLADRRSGQSVGRIAARFHNTVAAAVVAMCDGIRRDRGLSVVALSGGVFQNARLTECTARRLTDAGFGVLLHRQVPPNDGGLCLGQAAVACAVATEA